ncbi:MAG: chemotaxis protein CheW [Planctomycetota bacterium]
MSEREDPAVRLARVLSREPPAEYLAAWAKSLRRPVFSGLGAADRSAVVFQLGEECLALDTRWLVEIQEWRSVRRIPGRTNAVFRGLVSLRGELHLCADLHALLGVAHEKALPGKPRSPTSRLLVVARDEQTWTFEVDDVRRIVPYRNDDVLGPQVTVAKALVHFTDGLLQIDDASIARLDPDRLFDSLTESVR